MGRASRVDAVESYSYRSQSLALVPKYFPRVCEPVPIRVFENNDPIAHLQIKIDFGFRVGVVFANPQATLPIGRARDGLLHLGFRREQGRLKSFGKLQRCQRILRRKEPGTLFLCVVDFFVDDVRFVNFWLRVLANARS